MKQLCALLALGLMVQACEQGKARSSGAYQGQSLRLAVTTSTNDSGLLDELLPDFEKQTGARVDVLPVGTGKALKLGRSGDVDAVLVHDQKSELAFMKEGFASRRESFMVNSFEIVGPPNDPAGIRGLEPQKALLKLVESGGRFISRGDDSGTHKREHSLWSAGGARRPEWKGYIESGQGMGATLIMADQMKAYTITDHGTYLKMKKKLELLPLVTKGEALKNPYSVMVVSPEKHKDIRARLAEAFTEFLISAPTQKKIRDYKLEGELLFHPLRLESPSE